MNHRGQRIAGLHRQLGIPSDFVSTCKIPLQVEATDLTSIGQDMFGREQYLATVAGGYWREMNQVAAREGIDLLVVSAWRSVDYQCKLIQAKLDQGQAIDDILKVNTAPGFSEHHTGRALDLNTPGCEPLSEAFDKTEAFDWLQKNAARFGFALSYPRDNPYDIIYEPWHWACRP